jgi:hypothetical protein
MQPLPAAWASHPRSSVSSYGTGARMPTWRKLATPCRRPGPPASGPRQGLRGHGVSPHPMERGQPRWGRLPDPSAAPDVVTVHLNGLTHAFSMTQLADSYSSMTQLRQPADCPHSGGEVRELTPFYRNKRYVSICIL